MSRVRWYIGAAVAVLAALLLQWPLRLLPGTHASATLSATDLAGTLWQGHARDLAWQGTPLGDADLRFAPVLLLRGKLGWHAATSAASGDAVAWPVRGIAGANGSVSLRMPQGDAQLRMQDVDVLFDGDTCVAAGGRLQVELATPPATILQGTPRCEGADATVLLSSAGAAAPAWAASGIVIRLDADGLVTLQASAPGAQPVH